MENLKESFSQINELLSHNPKGLTVNEISEGLGVNRNTVAKYLEVMLALGEVEMKQYGPAKVWFYSPGISLNTLMDYSTSMMAVVDDSLLVKKINSTFLAFLGMEEDEVLERKATDAFGILGSGPGKGSEVSIDLESVLTSSLGGEAFELEELEIPLGEEEGSRIVSLKIYPTVFGGKQKGLAIICDDVTDMVLYERSLEESEELFHSMFYTANDGMVIIQEGRFTLLNDRCAEMIGVEAEEAIGAEVLTVIPDDQKELVARRLTERFEGRGTSDIYPIDIVRKDGERRTIEISGSLIQYKGKPADLVIVRDISDIRDKKGK
jgi:PAS domain S-box-containing protein